MNAIFVSDGIGNDIFLERNTVPMMSRIEIRKIFHVYRERTGKKLRRAIDRN